MKKNILALGLIILFSAGCLVMGPVGGRPYPRRGPYDRGYDRSPGGLTTGYFYDYLAPYGTWIRHRNHGYVWIPRNMGYRWRPYTHGHWIWSNYGWTWISDFDWGWAVFHYGRWGYDDRIGWFWVPGTDWGPAWVAWRSHDLYFGWAPLPPGIEWRPGYGFGGPFDVPDDSWIFVEGRNFLRSGIYSYILPFERNRAIVRMSQLRQGNGFRGDRVYNDGLDRDQVRRVTRETISPHVLRDAGQPGRDRVGGGEAVLFRPALKPDERAVPKKFVERDEADESVLRGRIYESETQRGGADDEIVIRRRQDEERKILERSQSEEARVLNRRYVEKSSSIRDQAEKAKMKKEQDAQAEDLKKKHDEEKTQLEERHKKDAETVRKGVIKKVEK